MKVQRAEHPCSRQTKEQSHWQHSQVGAWHCHTGLCMPQHKAAYRALTRAPDTPGLPLQAINTSCFSSASMAWTKRQWFNVRKKIKSWGGFWHWADCNCTGRYHWFLLFRTLNYFHFCLYISTIWTVHSVCTCNEIMSPFSPFSSGGRRPTNENHFFLLDLYI